MGSWLTIEVLHGPSSADSWREAYGERLIEAAITNGAKDWVWHQPRWGVILEIEFADEWQRDAFRELPAVTAALDAVPDAMSGLLVYPGRGGGSGAGKPRRPRKPASSGAAELPEPLPQFLDVGAR